jgi:hypothetical protein
MHRLTPTCMDGTTASPYRQSPTAPNAPNANSPPFCTTTTAESFMTIEFTYGYAGVTRYAFNNFYKVSQNQNFDFESIGTNSTCPTGSSENADSFTVIAQSNRLAITLSQETINVFNSQSLLQQQLNAFVNGHNLPFQLSTGSTTTYYMRNLASSTTQSQPTFQVATNTRDPPMNANELQAAFGTAVVKITFPHLSKCASQFKQVFRPGPGSSSINDDGTVKGSNGGICLTQEMQTGVRITIPGLIGSVLALIWLLGMALEYDSVRKLSFFNAIFVSVNVLAIILLIAALGHGSVIFSQGLAPCLFGSQLSNDQVMPAATSSAVNGFTPSSGGFDMTFASTGAPGTYLPVQNGNAAVYLKPEYRVALGAAFGIASVIALSILTMVFALKADWAGTLDSKPDAVAMTPA